jgi:hypothetical protein
MKTNPVRLYFVSESGVRGDDWLMAALFQRERERDVRMQVSERAVDGYNYALALNALRHLNGNLPHHYREKR